MVGALAGVVVAVLALAALVVLLGRAVLPAGPAEGRGLRVPAGRRAEVARAIAGARWSAAHDERDGVTRVLLRRSCTGPDGWPLVLEERVLTTIPSAAPDWEPRFTEAMAQARFRCEYLNTEEQAG